jgi:coproporphyrinogen III oxidase
MAGETPAVQEDCAMTDERKARARAWFETLRDEICAAFEALEDEAPAALYPGAPGRFVKTPWQRSDGSADQGGGVAGMMRGRFFEKVGVHVSTVYGQFSPEFAQNVRGAADDPRFWASGVSVIAHLRNPHCPAAHMNTRHITTTEWWFGGGGDLNPTQAYQRDEASDDAQVFHTPYRDACEAHEAGLYAKYKKWADEYFWLSHRGEPRGVGGIFYDHHNSGDKDHDSWEQDFAFTQNVGRAFLTAYLPLLRKHMATPWTEADREEQLVQRGRYVEFNLLYDRGTTFGLKTGGNVESILSSMPPVAKWP